MTGERKKRGDDPGAVLAGPPQRPIDEARFSANALFGQPGIYPNGPPMAPAAGSPRADHELHDVMAELVGTVGEPLVDAWNAGQLGARDLRYGTPVSAGRIVDRAGVERVAVDRAAPGGSRVVNDRYRAEDPRLVLPSLVHSLLWSGPGAGHAEETLMHALGAYVHAQLLARDPSLAVTGTELARRQNSITITLLNSRRPGSAVITLVAPDGPGTIPGGAPAMQTPDFWRVPFGPRRADGAEIPAAVRALLARAAASDVASVPTRYEDELGAWCSQHFVTVLTIEEQLAANQALGLLP